jgi:signal transduction histidine kinase
MVQISFSQGVGPDEVKQIRESVQKECIALKIEPKNGFIALFVVDELACNIMEHAHATWMELKVTVAAEKFTAVLRDNGIAFDTGRQVESSREKQIVTEENERRLGLSLIGRLVDSIHYSRDKDINQVVLEKSWALN